MQSTTSIDPTTSEDRVIRLAYLAEQFTPSQESFRRNERKKTYNPIHTAPTLNRVITHLEGHQSIDFLWARKRARTLVLEAEASRYVNEIQTLADLRQFLATLSLFLKTTETKGKKGMNKFNDVSNRRLAPEELAAAAWQTVKNHPWKKDFNNNKLIRLTGRIRGARSKWECLAVLAQYYPLKGVPQPLINEFVDELGKLEIATFQALVSQVLIFYKAQEQKQGR